MEKSRIKVLPERELPQITDHSPDQFQRRLLVFRKFKYIRHNQSNPIFHHRVHREHRGKTGVSK